MRDGVSFIDPDTAYIDADVKIGNDTVIEGNVVIKGNTEIGSDCYITSGSRIVDSKIGNNVTVTSSTVEEA
ncbi:bifunctional UDP-N-acetylglucosamine diphosphorylase/glucosamine-1-phosphate N-acetyltransferase GlmU, partial [Klebsiella pneumoniae]|nr:bifunctional UDP-N-acetylglucosamine diphosphorylase/glucosamine-1-phosphate N-acetyltransferase GlmU [Klebsiella pneumoniae]